MPASRALDWVLLDHTASAPVRVGDMVSSEPGGMPIYQVQQLADGQAWLRGERASDAQLMPLDRFRWRAPS